MDDYSLVPVEHQPEFDNFSLVPVDHDPFSADGVAAQTGQAQQPQTQQPVAGASDFFQSIPRGIVSGFSSAASALARATQGEMGQDVDAPTPEQATEILEKEVTGPLHRPEGRWGKFGASAGEFLGSPASYLAPGSLPFKAGTAVLGGLGSEAGGQLAEGTPWEAPLRFAGGALGLGAPSAVSRLGAGLRAAQTPVRAAEEAGAGLGPAASSFSPAEQAAIGEARSIATSPQMADLAAAHAAGVPMTVNIGGRLVQYEPNMPAFHSGMSLFGDNGFLIGPHAFSSNLEHNKTVLHELQRLRFSQSGDGVSGELAAQETNAARDFADRAAEHLP